MDTCPLLIGLDKLGLNENGLQLFSCAEIWLVSSHDLQLRDLCVGLAGSAKLCS